MAIYGIGSRFYGHKDVTVDFKTFNLVGTAWPYDEAPDLHEYFYLLKAGDIVYIKSCSYSSSITVKGIGIVKDERILGRGERQSDIEIGRNINWILDCEITINKPNNQKNNVRANTIYRETHPSLINVIMDKVDQYFQNTK